MPSNNNGDMQDKIEVHERLARMEAILEAIKEALEDQKRCDEQQDKKLDEILHNDKDKLQRITTTETQIKNLKATLWLFAVPLAAGIAKWFI